MSDCAMCGGEIVKGTCRNCGTPGEEAPVIPAAVDVERVDLPEVAGDLNLAQAGLAELVKAAGELARPEVAGTPAETLKAILGLTKGNDKNPGEAFDGAQPGTPGAERVTLFANVPTRTACERCMLPMFGQVNVRCVPRGKILDGSHLARLVNILSARLQSEPQLAEQVAAAIVGMGEAESASVRITVRRPCDECGAGRVETTARARRAALAGGDPPHEDG